MKKALVLGIVLISFNSVVAQTPYKFPVDLALSGKCFIKCLDYDELFEYKVVSCDSIDTALNTPKTKEQENCKNEKLLSYQEKLLSLGYKIKVTGVLDDSTLKAHDKYLLKKRKKERKEARALKRNKMKL